MRSAINTLGPTYNEFVYNQHPVTRSRFLCIKIIECDVENFDYNEHPLKRPVSFAYLLPTNEVCEGCFHRCLSVHGGVNGRGGHVWQGGRMTGEGACMAHTPPPSRYYEIRSMSVRYTSYWNAFLFFSLQVGPSVILI